MNDYSKSTRIFCSAVVVILAAFGGIGVAWIFVASVANRLPKEHGNAVLAGSIPTLVIGGTVGFAAGLAFALFLFKARPQSDQEMVERKYFGRRGGRAIFFSGFLSFLMFLPCPWAESLDRKFGNAAFPCVLFGIGIVSAVLSMLLCDRIPPHLVLPLGLLGWLLTFMVVCGYGWFQYHHY